MKVITFCNQKGGVAKTTTSLNVASILANLKGYKTLLIDLDPQANTSSIFNSGIENLKTISSFFEEDEIKNGGSTIKLENLIYQVEDNLSVIFSDEWLESAGRSLLQCCKNPPYKLYRAFKSLRESNKYDYVIIDTPPSTNIICDNAIIASDKIVIPVQTEKFSFDGCAKQIKYLTQINNQLIDFNFEPKEIVGMFFTLAEKNNLHKKYIDDGRKELTENGFYVFDAIIHKNISIAKSQDENKSVVEFDKGAKGTEDYVKFTEELLNKIN